MKTLKWYSGRLSIEMTKKQAESVSHSGPCDADVEALLPQLQEQLNRIDPAELRKELKEYGAWDEKELADHNSNLGRLIWIAGADISEGNI